MTQEENIEVWEQVKAKMRDANEKEEIKKHTLEEFLKEHKDIKIVIPEKVELSYSYKQ